MKQGVRKEITLREEVIIKLTELAKKKGWKLKPYMEWVLISKSETSKTKL